MGASGTPMSDFGIPGANTSDPKTAGLGSFQLGKNQISGFNGSPASGDQGLVISSFGDGLGVARCNCPLTERGQQVQFVDNFPREIESGDNDERAQAQKEIRHAPAQAIGQQGREDRGDDRAEC